MLSKVAVGVEVQRQALPRCLILHPSEDQIPFSGGELPRVHTGEVCRLTEPTRDRAFFHVAQVQGEPQCARDLFAQVAGQDVPVSASTMRQSLTHGELTPPGSSQRGSLELKCAGDACSRYRVALAASTAERSAPVASLTKARLDSTSPRTDGVLAAPMATSMAVMSELAGTSWLEVSTSA
jgi:hypothetical protein